jgi:hypothetical protein
LIVKAPNYDWSDLVAYVGLLAGLGISWVVMPLLGFEHQIAKMVVGVLLGAGIGYFARQAFLGSSRKSSGG